MFFANTVLFLILVAALLIALGMYHVLTELRWQNKKDKKNTSKWYATTKTFILHFFLIFILVSFLVPFMLWFVRSFHP
jgi:uncharacterized membrane protein YidH (DUF202 family)